ncbi:MAG: Signal peptidase I S [Firmicutes bacterium ADurb.Bin182]|nr:MAG: Signal peptidase I S [Firmicutes bacterium ADurb.Bin182]
MNNKLTKSERKAMREAVEKIHDKDPAYKRASNIGFLFYLATVIICVFAFRNFLMEPIDVDGISMNYTLLDRERMLVEKVSMWLHKPERGEIIIVYYPGYTQSCVKRVIGLPGETVEIRGGETYIDGKKLAEDYLFEPMFYDMPPVTVPENSVFVMGDNRNSSEDSRDPNVGSIPFHKIVGRVVAVMWPPDSIRSMTG